MRSDLGKPGRATAKGGVNIGARVNVNNALAMVGSHSSMDCGPASLLRALSRSIGYEGLTVDGQSGAGVVGIQIYWSGRHMEAGKTCRGWVPSALRTTREAKRSSGSAVPCRNLATLSM